MRLRLLLIAAVLFIAPMAFAGTASLNDWCFYVNTLDINRSCNDGAGSNNFNPPTVTSTTFDYHLGDNNALGQVVITLAAGNYNIFAIFNYDINSPSNPQESASTHGVPVGQVYSVDSQGDSAHVSNGSGSLYTQFTTGDLDNTNHCTSGCSDVAVSLGYENLTVPDGQTATVTFTAGNTPPSSGFYVQQTDGSGNDISFSSSVQLTDNSFSADTAPPGVPEPGTIGLMTGGLGLMLFRLRRRKA